MGLLQELKSLITFESVADATLDAVLTYLDKYGYIKRDGQITGEEILNAIQLAKKFIGVNENGLGPRTIKQMLTGLRCGCVDVPPGTQAVTVSGSWGPDELTYYFDSYVDGLSKDDQHNIAKRCFEKVSAVIDLKFVQVNKSQNANFIFRASNSVRDGLGRPGNVLAFNYLPTGPNFSGQLEGVFDLAETWIDNPTQRGILYDAVFTHEVAGHGLGLYHSDTPNQLLNPYYSPNIRELQNEDKSRLLALYGASKKPPKPPQDDTKTNELVLKIKGRIDSFELPGYRIQKIG